MLSNKNKEFCDYAGLGGLVISFACMLQMFIFMKSHWINYIMLGVYFFSTVAYSFFIARKTFSPLLVLTSTILALLSDALLLAALTFSLIMLVLVLYSTVVTVFIYILGLPAKFRSIAETKKTEDNYWRDKL